MRRPIHHRLGLLAVGAAAAALASAAPLPALARDCDAPSMGLPPLTDLGAGEHLGFQGGLYPAGSNAVPTAHAADGAARAAAVVPLDSTGLPDPNGKIVVLMIGMSNGVLEFRRMVEKLEADPEIDPARIVLAMGARGGQSAEFWEDPAHENFERIEDQVLGDLGVTEAQVQVVLVKSALQSQGSPPTLPAINAQVYDFERALGNGARALASRYANLQQVFYTSRIYAGFATSDLSPEPYAWETGLGVKWLIDAQITQRGAGVGDPESGDLGTGVAPWLAWGPYLWANGETPREDGFFWACTDLRADDGTHPDVGAIEKVADAWSGFLRSSPFTRPWLLGEAPADPRCGDGVLDAGETCDDGNSVAGDGCSAVCQSEATCGDGTVDAGESCDDGNVSPGDGCDAQCGLETSCGDGNTEGVEECDDGNAVPGDGCSAICRIELCPDPARGTCTPAPAGRLSVLERKPGREKLSLRLNGFGAESALFGDPVRGDTRYGICLYDSSGARVTELVVDRAGALCGPKARECWRPNGKSGHRYRDQGATAAGVTHLRLRPAEDPRGKATARAGNRATRGQTALPVDLAGALAGHTSATVQLAAHDGGCIEAVLTRVTRDDGSRWKARTE